MVAMNYIRSTSFIVDLVSTLPIAEISEALSSSENTDNKKGDNYIIWVK